MARTLSTMLPLGTVAPNFVLPDTQGQLWSLESFKTAQALLVVFMCNHCPYVIHIRQALAQFARDYQPRGLATVGINANDASGYPLDAPEKMAEEVRLAGYTFPYLYDETQVVAKAYQAACTPDFFLFDAQKRLYYRGQFDASRPNQPTPVTGIDLRKAADTLLAGLPFEGEQFPSMGCNIKWKPGNSPDDA